MILKYYLKFIIFFLIIVLSSNVYAQRPRTRIGNEDVIRSNTNNNTNNPSLNPKPKMNTKDSLLGFEHREDDSITIQIRHRDSINWKPYQRSYQDFYPFYSVPLNYMVLGNHGAAAYNIKYQPNNKIGYDAGMHAYDIYRFNFDNIQIFKVTKPLTELGFQSASGKEQMIKVTHAQTNKQQNGFGFQYRLITSPGYLVTQNSSHRSYSLYYDFTSKKKRLKANITTLGNLIRHSENGGLILKSYVDSSTNKFFMPLKLGGASGYVPNPFQTKVNTGNIQSDNSTLLKVSYDFGKQDSIIINDSTTDYVFYPRFRVAYSIQTNRESYSFIDNNADSLNYNFFYDTVLKRKNDTVNLTETFKIVSQTFSIRTFPNFKNIYQYLDIGATFESINNTTGGKNKFSNLIGKASYRNTTKNKLWNLELDGQLYLIGEQLGDFNAQFLLARNFNKNKGSIQLFAQLNNKSNPQSFEKNAVINIRNKAVTNNQQLFSFGGQGIYKNILFGVKNSAITNMFYYKNLYEPAQYNKLVNLLQANAAIQLKISKQWNYSNEMLLQLVDNASPIKVPLLLSTQKIFLAGQFFKNLNINTGFEIRYFTPFKALDYNPITSQFFVNNNAERIQNIPDINFYSHFRIRNFIGFLRVENLNTFRVTKNNTGFNKYNFAASNFPTSGLVIRFGFNWLFIN